MEVAMDDIATRDAIPLSSRVADTGRQVFSLDGEDLPVASKGLLRTRHSLNLNHEWFVRTWTFRIQAVAH